jgi:hypothetical protein
MSPTRTPASADGPNTFPTTIFPEACIAAQRSASQRIAVAQSVAADLVRIQAEPDLRLGKRYRVVASNTGLSLHAGSLLRRSAQTGAAGSGVAGMATSTA